MYGSQGKRSRWGVMLATCVLSAAVSAAWAAAMPPPTSYDRTPQKSVTEPGQLSSQWYARGAKTKHKAEEAKDPKDRQKLYDRAKEELSKSVGFEATRDNLVALGQVYLAIGDAASASTSCLRAAGLKPGDEEATACAEAAKQKMTADAAPAAGAPPSSTSAPSPTSPSPVSSAAPTPPPAPAPPAGSPG